MFVCGRLFCTCREYRRSNGVARRSIAPEKSLERCTPEMRKNKGNLSNVHFRSSLGVDTNEKVVKGLKCHFVQKQKFFCRHRARP